MRNLLALLLMINAFSALSFTLVSSLNGTEGGPALAFSSPSHLFIDSGGRLYIANSGKNIIMIYRDNLSFLGTKGSGQEGNGQNDLDQPSGVWVDSAGQLYIADTFNHRIQVFTGYDGSYLKTIPPTDASGVSYSLHRPMAVAVQSNGLIHVADTHNNRIAIFNSRGLYQRSILSTVSTDNTAFISPSDIYIDEARGRIFVADTDNDRVQVFDMNYSIITRLGRGEGENNFLRPTALTIDSDGDVYVADTGHNRVQIFDRNFTFIGSVKGNVSGNASFSAPSGVVVDMHGRLYVSDPAGRVLVFQSVGLELERQSALNQLNDARSSLNLSLQKFANASAKVTALKDGGCVNPASAEAYLELARNSINIANSSLRQAEASFLNGDYRDVAAPAYGVKQFAQEAFDRADLADRDAKRLREQAGVAIDSLATSSSLISQASNLNATARRLNFTLQESPALAIARSYVTTAQEKCRETDYAAATQLATIAQGNATQALNSARNQVNLKVVPIYNSAAERLQGLKNAVTQYDLPLETQPVELDLALANTYLSESRFDEALDKLDLVDGNLTIMRTLVDSYVGTSNSTQLIREGVASTRNRTVELEMRGADYNQSLNTSQIASLLVLAEANLTTHRIDLANQSLSLANGELDILNQSLELKIGKILDANLSINFAEANLSAAHNAGIPLILRPNLTEARNNVSEARSILYQNPDKAKELADNAAIYAQQQRDEIAQKRPIYIAVIVGGILLLVVILLVFTGASAGLLAALRWVRRRKVQPEEKAKKNKNLVKLEMKKPGDISSKKRNR